MFENKNIDSKLITIDINNQKENNFQNNIEINNTKKYIIKYYYQFTKDLYNLIMPIMLVFSVISFIIFIINKFN